VLQKEEKIKYIFKKEHSLEFSQASELEHKNLTLLPPQSPLHPAEKKKNVINKIKKIYAQLTALNSRGLNIRCKLERTGTMRMRKNGNAREAAVDFTTQRTAKQAPWMNVNKCIFAVFTWK
jgi:hypothetical protein